jgi:sortase A
MGEGKKEKERAMKRRIKLVLILLLLLVGSAMLLYPTAAQWWNARHQSQIIDKYTDTVSALEQDYLDSLWEEATAYNDTHPVETLMLEEGEDQTYRETLDVTGTGVMGYLTIPKINVNLPIYHGTEESVLQVGIGHLSGTSLPVGGKGTHCVLSGHRGLPSSRLLTDLSKMEIGDTFTLEVLGRTLTYQVVEILTVDPSDTESLYPDPEEDLCTLVTCTPYGINSHRLLVRGSRVETETTSQTETQQETTTGGPEQPMAVIGVILLLALIVSGIRLIRRRRQHET